MNISDPKKRTEYYVKLSTGEFVFWGIGRPCIHNKKPSTGWSDRESADAFASQVDGTVITEQCEYMELSF